MPSGTDDTGFFPAATSLRRMFVHFAGRKLLRFTDNLHGLAAFALITFGAALGKLGAARKVMAPLLIGQVNRAGLRLLPMISFLGIALGIVIIGQTIFLLSRIGAQHYAGTVMVTVVVRELGPIVTAIVVLARIGAATVIELGTSRALGEIEALEALGIDPVHYLVVPRVFGMAVSVFALTIYFILTALVSGYLFAFLQNVPLTPGDYFLQLAGALQWQDFVLLALKSALFGIIIAIVSCYQGLARPLRIEDVSGATTRAVGHSVVACVLVDALFIAAYLVI